MDTVGHTIDHIAGSITVRTIGITADEFITHVRIGGIEPGIS